jgi:hypothetical protein
MDVLFFQVMIAACDTTDSRVAQSTGRRLHATRWLLDIDVSGARRIHR